MGTSTFWGDGQNANWNYIGWIAVVLALVCVVRYRRRPWIVPLAVVAVGTLVLSLGPSLKVDERREIARPDPVTIDWYLMPAEASTAPLPTEWLFRNVPGVDFMRATYRWASVTRMVLVVLAAVALSALARGRGLPARAVLAAVALLGFVEVMPDLPTVVAEHVENERSRVAFQEDAMAELKDMTTDGETVLFLPFGNTYLANILVPEAGLRSYNVAGDKNVELAVERRPPLISSIVERGYPRDVLAAFGDESLDAVVLPHYSLRWDADLWPPASGPTPIAGRYADFRKIPGSRSR